VTELPEEETRKGDADLEIAGAARWGEARWRTRPKSEKHAYGDVETEELSEREGIPEAPRPEVAYPGARLRWRFRARLRDVLERSRSRSS
jgi:hypothetical protein